MQKYLLSYLIYFLIFISLSLFFILYLYNNNKQLIKIEKIVAFNEINQSKILEYFSVVEKDLISKLSFIFINDQSLIDIIKILPENNDSMFYKLFNTNSNTNKFNLLNEDFTSSTQNLLWDYMREINKETDIIFENVISKSNVNHYLRTLDMQINLYGINEKDTLLRLEKIIKLSNTALFYKLRDETLDTVNRIIANLKVLGQYQKLNENNLNDYVDLSIDLEITDTAVFSEWYNHTLYESFQKRKNIEKSTKDILNFKIQIEEFFENNINERENFYVNLDDQNYYILNKPQYNIFTYVIFLIALCLLLPILFLYLQKQINRIKFEN